MSNDRGQDGALMLGGRLVGSPLVNGALLENDTTMDIDAVTLTGIVAVGDTFTLAGEAGSPTHTVTGGPFYVAAANAIASITFSTAIAAGGVADDAAVTFADNAVAELLSWTLDHAGLELIDDTVKGDTHRTFKGGLARWSGSAAAWLDYDDPQQASLIDGLAPGSVGGFTDFSEYASGSPPSDWTRTVGTGVFDVDDDVLFTGEKKFHQDVNSPDGTAYGWDDSNDGETIQELVTRIKVQNGSSSPDKVELVVRDDGIGNHIKCRLDPTNNAIRFYFGVTLISSAPFTHALDQFVWLRFRVSGTDLKARAWADGDPEPAAWTLESSFAISVTSGRMGVITDFFDRFEMDVFGFATAGATAPTSSADAAPDGTIAALLLQVATGKVFYGAAELANFVVGSPADGLVPMGFTFKGSDQFLIDA